MASLWELQQKKAIAVEDKIKAESDLELLEAFSGQLDANAVQLVALAESLETASNCSESLKEKAEDGALQFIKGAFYCGQEIGTSEQFQDIGTQCDSEKEMILAVYEKVLSSYAAYQDHMARAAQAIISCRSFISSKENLIASLNTQIANAKKEEESDGDSA